MNYKQVLEIMPVELQTAVVPPVTASYQPVAHDDFVGYLAAKVEESGYNIVGSTFNHASYGNKMVGTLRVEHPTLSHDTFGMSMAFMNSYDKSLTLGLGVGGSVFVCTNSMMVADVTRLRKHTTNINKEVGGIVNTQLSYMDRMFNQFAEDVEVLKSTPVTKNKVHELVGEMFVEQKLLTTTQINILRSEMYESKNFQMFGAGGDMSLWSLYQNTTEALKKSHPSRIFKDHANVRALMLEAV